MIGGWQSGLCGNDVGSWHAFSCASTLVFQFRHRGMAPQGIRCILLWRHHSTWHRGDNSRVEVVPLPETVCPTESQIRKDHRQCSSIDFRMAQLASSQRNHRVRPFKSFWLVRDLKTRRCSLNRLWSSPTGAIGLTCAACKLWPAITRHNPRHTTRRIPTKRSHDVSCNRIEITSPQQSCGFRGSVYGLPSHASTTRSRCFEKEFRLPGRSAGTCILERVRNVLRTFIHRERPLVLKSDSWALVKGQHQ